MATKKVKDTVSTVKNEAKEAAKKISMKAEPAVEAAKNTVKAVSEKAEPAVKKAKTAAKTATDKAKSAAKTATDKAKTATKKVASALTPDVFVEFGGAKYECSKLADRCKEDYKAKHPGERIRSCRVYIKPEDGMAYYVINELADKIAL